MGAAKHLGNCRNWRKQLSKVLIVHSNVCYKYLYAITRKENKAVQRIRRMTERLSSNYAISHVKKLRRCKEKSKFCNFSKRIFVITGLNREVMLNQQMNYLNSVRSHCWFSCDKEKFQFRKVSSFFYKIKAQNKIFFAKNFSKHENWTWITHRYTLITSYFLDLHLEILWMPTQKFYFSRKNFHLNQRLYQFQMHEQIKCKIFLKDNFLHSREGKRQVAETTMTMKLQRQLLSCFTRSSWRYQFLEEFLLFKWKRSTLEKIWNQIENAIATWNKKKSWKIAETFVFGDFEVKSISIDIVNAELCLFSGIGNKLIL